MLPSENVDGSNCIGPSAPAELAPPCTPGRFDCPLSDSTVPMAARTVQGRPGHVDAAAWYSVSNGAGWSRWPPSRQMGPRCPRRTPRCTSKARWSPMSQGASVRHGARSRIWLRPFPNRFVRSGPTSSAMIQRQDDRDTQAKFCAASPSDRGQISDARTSRRSHPQCHSMRQLSPASCRFCSPCSRCRHPWRRSASRQSCNR